MKILSLFDGISCARVSLERAGIPVEAYYASEIDKYAMQISAKNYPDIVQLGSVVGLGYDAGQFLRDGNTLGIDYMEDIDILIGGFPCTDLSIAKKNRQGLKGEASGLFYEMIRIHKEVKPKFFIYENVASMSKENKETILKTIQEIDPSAYVIMINASLVSAQNRKRLFFTNIPNVTQPEDGGILLKDILEQDVDEKYFIDVTKNKRIKGWTENERGLRPHKGDKSKTGISEIGRITNIDQKTDTISTNHAPTIRIGQIGKGGQGDRIYSPEGKSVGLSALGGGRGAKTGLYAVPVALRNRGEGKKPEYNGTDKANSMTTVQTDSIVAMIQTPRGYNKGGIKALDGKTPTLSSSSWEHNNHIIEDTQIRKLTPTECERLQGVPDNYTEGVSNSQRYKMLGNAFNVDVVAHILSSLNNPKYSEKAEDTNPIAGNYSPNR